MSFNSRVMNTRILVNMALNKYAELVKRDDLSEGIQHQSIAFIDATQTRVRDENNKIARHIDNIKQGLNELVNGVKKFESANQFNYEREMTVDNYLNLLDSLMKVLYGNNTDIPESLVSEVVQLQLKINEEFSSNKQSGTDSISTSLTGDIISVSLWLDNQLSAESLKKLKIEHDTRINRELDTYRDLLDKKLSEISSQYSEGRSQLIASADEHREAFNSSREEMKKEVEEYRNKITHLHTEVESKKTKIEEMTTAASECLNIANGTLKKTSQVGMAGAFQKRREELTYPVIIWFLAFIGFLCVLAYIGVDIVQFAFMKPSENAEVSMVQLISKLAVSFPAIWGAWFSAKQYSHASQLQEDYAYKVSIAMTYHGYKDEAGLVDEKMSEKLLDSMIAQFSDNPVRLYQNNNSASVLEAMLKNDKFSDIINSAKNGVSGSAK
ncbi:hypothetical protein [Aeromonas salmonicida]